MGKYFGTDGVRGIANKGLTPELAFKLGRFGGYVLTKETQRPKVIVGRDTRISGHMLEGALVAGLLSIGAEVMRLGVISTPGVAYLTKATSSQAGVMISASHNPVEDNGIKFFGPDGFKLSDAQENEIEQLMEEEDNLPRPTGGDVGTVNDYFEGGQKYLSFLKDTIDNDFEGIRIALDCAHGATSSLATHLFADLEADIFSIGSSPDGLNINDGVGSTHPETLQAFVEEKNADIGLAFDGDGDRLIAVDEKGNIVDGDQIMFICAKYMNEKGFLRKNTVVSTVMSNIGFYKAIEKNGMRSDKTAVGDRYVMEEMRKGGYNLGGEQSGHIIFLDYNTTGDGMLSAIQLVNVMRETGKPLSELAGEMAIFPQVLKNVKVIDKNEALSNSRINEEIEAVEKELGDQGRVLVRPSGTEPLVRVMVEAPTKEECEKYVDQVANVIDQLLGMKE
ncbi:phosphoglucosamine mutase [Virgibacillus halodenitrificans]|uniref:Phosphoglucosamine mutase n=1 Tax=Virgibacillus halodenitrificans TaxID=1482 RepID=A0AAC9IZB1_VIRHA|nr:phosphoglucosamine mutase [Virgibacillus halodenitrificans]APC46895.1 phosphoglucosamine mutase [Virgibacillus halodenitrificans]MCG1027515.1 phosphoglucosamine mutase [Virgibacillus halodenitrificans]MEC2159269.1 phosphoglucosamine mutase [Virgibacillus halodenitrificans]MYL47556.1 phosphoglucosamine mutase [Virgibacillus halodenitrificans]WHX25387.1 phosphoglucosamine mutase [Virgibacillus halodenitrificans]